MWTIVSYWVARSVLEWRHVDYCFRLGGSECASVVTYGLLFHNWVARTVLVCRHMDYCFKLGGSKCASVATYGLLFQTGWLGVC
jgi:hypothetical protein